MKIPLKWQQFQFLFQHKIQIIYVYDDFCLVYFYKEAMGKVFNGILFLFAWKKQKRGKKWKKNAQVMEEKFIEKLYL